MGPTPEEFSARYLETWTEPDADRRREIIDVIWKPDGRLVVSSLGLTVEGVDEIAAHIARVHDENIVGHGLRFVYDQQIEAADAVLLRWSMISPAGEPVARGADVLFQDPDGRVQTAYMFMGVD